MLEVEGLVVRYGGVHAVRGIDLTVNDGQVVGVVGPNGAGKSSLLKAIAGLVRPAAGRLTWNGRSLAGRAPHQLVHNGIILVPEGRGLLTSLTAAENLATAGFARRRSTAEMRDARDEVLELFPGLRQRLAHTAGSLSGGEQQMLVIARALLMRPELLILDELSLGLAPRIVKQIYDVLRRKNGEGLTILLVEQHLPFVLSTADDVYVLRRGQVDRHGPPDLVGPTLQRSYLGVAGIDGRPPATTRTTEVVS